MKDKGDVGTIGRNQAGAKIIVRKAWLRLAIVVGVGLSCDGSDD